MYSRVQLILKGFCVDVNRFESGDGHQCQRHCQYVASSRHAQVLEGKTSRSEETGMDSTMLFLASLSANVSVLGSVTVRTLDLQSQGRGFDSWSRTLSSG